MRIKKSLLFLLSIFILISLVSAAPPVTTIQQINDGYIIEDSPQTLLKQGLDYQYNFFVLNLSNGALKTNTTVSCINYITNSEGKIISMNSVTYSPLGYWSLNISSGNYSTPGLRYYGTRCNSTSLAGTDTGIWEVTPNGNAETTSDSINMTWQIIILIFTVICFMTMGILFNINGVKIFFFVLAGLTLFLLVGIALLTSQNYLYDYTQYSSVYSAFYVMFAIIGGVGVLGLVIWLIYYIFTKFSKTKIGDFDDDDY